MSGMEKPKSCACDKQIVFFFENPTVIICEECEITFFHDQKECPYCSKPVTYFIKEERK
jgi:rubrerythrin